ncbi:MAG: hypothetical protein PUH21_01480 [Prevotellaceae bacterium]|nr:hypothetical protein [Prevotellaceae bacterium]MDY3856441.1 hypothetical protein [Bacteroidaceae bacterium]
MLSIRRHVVIAASEADQFMPDLALSAAADDEWETTDAGQSAGID